ncbi:MAG: HlyD family type I secretion periplasmic adaptor subunit [Betaproteobacteria bacterium]|nr:HlyD family type I secretion periplasmic adaptor subunit [Betaproteobacteria bacterium]
MSTGKPPSQDVEHYGQSRVVLLLSIGIFALFVLWAYFAELDRITRGVGQVISSSRSQVVQSYDGGVLERLLIKPGQMVKKGQLLAVLDPTRSEANYEETRAKVMSLKAQIARLNAEMLDKPLVFSKEVKGMPLMVTAQTELYQKRRKALREDIESLNRSLDLAQQELKMNEPLLAAGDTSLADVLRLRRQVAELQAQITTRRNKYFQDTQAELTQAESELASITQTMKARRDALDRTELRAPMAGLVKSIRITTVGATLKPGEEILELVPAEDDLIVEVRIRPQDVGYLRPGLPVTVKIDAYDYTIYGTLSGTLDYLSPDTLNEELKPNEQPYYRAQVKIVTRQFSARPNEAIELQPGMTATAEIKTGSNTVLKYLTKPVIKTFSEAMRER